MAAMVVGDVMTRGVVTAHEGALYKEIVSALTRNHVGAVPVIDSGRRVLGIISESDLLTRVSGGDGLRSLADRLRIRRDTRRTTHAGIARELMTSPAITTMSDTTIVDAARLVARTRVRRLPVVDRTGVLVGIVTRGDLLKIFLRDDEEIRDDVERIADPFPVTVDVHEGVVTLVGQLEGRSAVRQLIEAVRLVSGVVDIDDRMTYRAEDTVVDAAWPATY